MAYGNSDIHAVVYNNFGLVTPDTVKQVRHNKGGLIPY